MLIMFPLSAVLSNYAATLSQKVSQDNSPDIIWRGKLTDNSETLHFVALYSRPHNYSSIFSRRTFSLQLKKTLIFREESLQLPNALAVIALLYQVTLMHCNSLCSLRRHSLCRHILHQYKSFCLANGLFTKARSAQNIEQTRIKFALAKISKTTTGKVLPIK
ncbi:hypothetical protein TcasGA2_TC001344 [Tribolium castaneum]|uniref:Uncharacterized protein n=1 Tax=Tribolium castaneum TaxID=7070 RepID=D6WC94_TRICA|nr:hypothetical protein TcasGA2_TC001344 [Tribolium castaneum]